jgi:hypothetical protein
MLAPTNISGASNFYIALPSRPKPNSSTDLTIAVPPAASATTSVSGDRGFYIALPARSKADSSRTIELNAAMDSTAPVAPASSALTFVSDGHTCFSVQQESPKPDPSTNIEPHIESDTDEDIPTYPVYKSRANASRPGFSIPFSPSGRQPVPPPALPRTTARGYTITLICCMCKKENPMPRIPPMCTGCDHPQCGGCDVRRVGREVECEICESMLS